ncbi:carboxypeptidase-like regulatory domain-containing protein [Granulicella aggregans]|uniref:carboxypeptidase-like regulatory domain-containing protein n=1 Tax=Granulicella aggregans TaxID=474949 RepID=UPI003D7C24F2
MLSSTMAGVILLCVPGFAAMGIAQTPATLATAEAAPPKPAAAQGGTISGTVKSGTIPLPGVAVTATNTLTGKKYATTTDITGAFSMSIPRNGRYVLRAELAAFASVTQETLINADGLNGGKPAQVADFGMQLASRQAAEESQTATVSGAITRGLQSLNVQRGKLDTADASSGTGNAGAALPSAATGDAAGSDSVTVSGAVGQTNGLAGVSEDDIRQRIQDAMQQAQRQGGANGDVMNAVAGMLGGIMSGGGPGGFGGPGGGGGRGGRGGGGGFRNFNPSQPHGTIYYQGAYNGLNAVPYSLTGAPTPNLGGAQNSFGITLSGSPSIPHIMKASSKQFFFLSVTGQRNITPENFYGTVPTDVETGRATPNGPIANNPDFSALGIAVYDPQTGQPFANDTIPNGRLSSTVKNLLAYYPSPNITNVGTQNYNYQTITNAGANRDTASLRYVRNFGQNASNPFAGFGGSGGGGRRNGGNSNGPPTITQNINFNGSYSHSASDSRSIFLPFGGSSSSDSYGVTAGYTISYGRLRNNASLNWNRSHAFSTNYFTNKATDPIDNVGLSIPKPVIGADPGIYYGLPSLSFTGFTGISTPSPSDKVNQTISFSDFVAWNHKKHNMRFGFDIRRVHADSIGGTNALGTLTFSGYATQCVATDTATCPTTPTGSGFADFLLGLPQQSKIQASAFKTYLRANVFDWYAQDDWRALPSLTLNFGLRYEYFSPYVEKFNHLVNLDHNADFTAVAAILPSQKGSYSGNFPRSLVNPDRNLYSPRLGFAYRAPETFLPALTKQMVVRGGYGINFNTGQYATIASQLASQPSPAGTQPAFAITQTNIADSQGCGALALSNAFGCSNATVQNNFSANKDYRLGHVQVWNVDIQKTLPLQIVANIGYNGSKGGGLDILRAPNRTAFGLLNPEVAAFNYEDSLGYSRFNGLSINVRKRMQKGISLQASYLYGHSIDDASSIGGSGSVVAQDPANLRAEEANSSFDIRHQVSGNWVLELPFGPNRAFLAAGGFWSKALDGFSVSGNYAFQTGSYYTPNFVNTVQEIATGVSSSQRADRNFAVPISGSKTFSSWFNPAAFSAPATGAYGNASRNSIEGPGVVSVNSSLSRTLQLGSTRSFEARLQANNVFNTIQYSGINTTLNSPTFGQVSSVASTRSLTFIARYRF